MPPDARRLVTYAHRRNRKRQREDGYYLVPSTAPSPQLQADDNISLLEMSRRMLKRSRPSTSFSDHQLTGSSSISSEMPETLPKSKRGNPSSTLAKAASKLKPIKRTKYKTQSMKQKENSARSHAPVMSRGLLSASLQPSPIAQRRTTRAISKASDPQGLMHVTKDREKVQKTQALLLASPFVSRHSSPTTHISHIENPTLNRKHTSTKQLKPRRTMPDIHYNSNFPYRTNGIEPNKHIYSSHLDFQPPTPIIPPIPKRSQTVANVNGCSDLPWDIDITGGSSLAPIDFNRPPSQSPLFQFNTEDIEGMSFGQDIQGISTPIRRHKPKRTLNRDTTIVPPQMHPTSALPSSLPPATPHLLDISVAAQNQYSPWVTDSLISPPTMLKNPVSPVDHDNNPDYNAFAEGGEVTQEVTHVEDQPEEMENRKRIFDNFVDSLCLGSTFGLRARDATQPSVTQSPPAATNNTNDIATSRPSLMSTIPTPAMGSINNKQGVVVGLVIENQINLPSYESDKPTSANSSSSLQAYINAIPTPLMSPASRDLPSNSKTMVAPNTVSAIYAPPSSSPDPLDLFKYDWLNDTLSPVSRRRKPKKKKRTRFFGLRESPPEQIGDDELNIY